jgi:hypothetical protein
MARGRGNFGLSSARGSSRGSFRGNRGGGSWRGGRGRGRGRGGSKAAGEGAPKREDDGTQLEEKFEKVRVSDELDEKLGFALVQEGLRKEGWLVNMHPVRPATFLQLTYRLIDCRHSSKTRNGHQGRLRSTFTSYKTMAGCSSARTTTSLISISAAR